MSKGQVNTGGGGSGAKLTVNAPSNVNVIISKDGKSKQKNSGAAGQAVFKGLAGGTWQQKLQDGERESTPVPIDIVTDYASTLNFFAAYINVTFPAGSTLTCTKGALVLTADVSASDTTYTFTVPELGDWTITISNGVDDPVSETVTITEEGQTESVELDYKLYLYKRGNVCENVTGGWGFNGAENARISFEQEYIRLYNANTTWNGHGTLYSKNKIDTTGYKSLHVIYDAIYVPYASENNFLPTIGLGNDTSNNSSKPAYGSVVCTSSNLVGSDLTMTVDISNTQGQYYVRFFALGEQLIKEIWLK